MNIVRPINVALCNIPPWIIYIVGGAWAGWLFWQGLMGLGRFAVEPINVLERDYGEIALQLLVLGLVATPLRRWTGISIIRFRRAIGVTAFFFVLAHFLVFAILDIQNLGRVWTEIVKRPYVTVGMASFLLLIPLVMTSNDAMVRRMGAASWRRLHKLTYPAAVLGGVHYLWLVRGFPFEPLVYLAVIGVLLVARSKAKRKSSEKQQPTTKQQPSEG